MTEEKLQQELARVETMCAYEKEYTAEGYEVICGLDEAGRGPLAGPVVAAAVVLPKDLRMMYINDSKKLTEKRREKLFDEIKEKAIAYGIGIVDEKRIDEINILQADYEAMREALRQVAEKVQPDLLLNDAVTIPEVEIKQVPLIKGDAKSQSIAAASVLAKVTRDRIMQDLDKQYPGYGLAKHKGYGTKAHIDAIIELGPTPIHRKTFLVKMDEWKKKRGLL